MWCNSEYAKCASNGEHVYNIKELFINVEMECKYKYSHFRNYAPLDVKGGIITEKVFPVFYESFFWTCFGLVMYIWELMGVTEKLVFQM